MSVTQNFGITCFLIGALAGLILSQVIYHYADYKTRRKCQ